MIEIIVYASIRGHVIEWLFDGIDEPSAVKCAKKDLKKKGLCFKDYILA